MQLFHEKPFPASYDKGTLCSQLMNIDDAAPQSPLLHETMTLQYFAGK